MYNFKVLFKFSLVPKVTSKKALIGLLSITLVATILITLTGLLVANAIETNNSETLFTIADEFYVYPDNNTSKNVAKYLNNATIIDDLADAKVTDQDESSQILINLDTHQVTSDFELNASEKVALSTIIVDNEINANIRELGPNAELKYREITNEPTFINKYSINNDNEKIIKTLSMLGTIMLYFLILFGFHLIGAEVFEEKSSRAMEIIITNTTPQVHMLVKIISNLIFILIMMAMAFFGMFLGFVIIKNVYPDIFGVIADFIINYVEKTNVDIDLHFSISVVLGTISSILSLLIFQIIAATLAAMTTTYEEYQKLNAPIMMLLLIPYLLALIGIDAISKMLVYIPIFTPFFAPNLYLDGQLAFTSYLACILIQLFTVLIMIKLVAPIYREGLLNYKTVKIKKLIKRSYFE